MFRDDTLGITSVIRTLMLDGSCYETMLHFFYSRAWNLDVLRQTWYSVVFSSGHVQRVNGKYVLAGDGVKTSKEALRMQGVKKHFQESEDSSKGGFIHGHMFRAVGAVIGKGTDSFCVPLRMGIQEGLAEASAKIYGQTKKVRYLSWDLLWGQRLYRKLRFVLVTYDGKKSILASTDLELPPCRS